ncbi:DUF1127 domain-containing protein [Consotaella aegiceratis]|uniref:DUF1127 domain-containing protein n=1 Tax=Consotaella aegiceratis TaxID=3097961 RepID=UPI003D8073D9
MRLDASPKARSAPMDSSTRTSFRTAVSGTSRPDEGQRADARCFDGQGLWWRIEGFPVRLWIARRRQRQSLADLTEDQLDDIGLTRTDVRRECRKPFWR